MNGKLITITDFAAVRGGDLVTFLLRGEPTTRRAQPLLCNPAAGTVVVNMGGRYGTPAVVTPPIFISARGRRQV